MTTFTKEQLTSEIETLEHFATNLKWTNVKGAQSLLFAAEVMRQALAGMEAEPVAFYQHDGTVMTRGSFGFDAEPGKSITLYSAPPAQVAQEKTDREMLKRLAVILSGSDAPGEIRSLTVTARSFVERCKTLAKERDASRTAMQPAHVPPGGKAVQPLTTEIMELVDRITGHRLSVAKMSELRPCIFEACRAAMQSGAVKDGWVVVPVEPTAEMISSGIAAHYERTKIQIHDRPAPGPMECAYVAMIAAAPEQEGE